MHVPQTSCTLSNFELNWNEIMESDENDFTERRRTIRSEFRPCRSCGDELKEPYVKCAVCQPDECRLCLACFCSGHEVDDHKNDHGYQIMRNDFQFSPSSWKAVDELKLLSAIDDSGFGNWVEVSKETGKSATDCENHYLRNYIDYPASPLPQLSNNANGFHTSVPTPFPYTVKDDPPRPVFDTQLHLDMAGYSAARGDFITEYNNYAEMNLKDIEFGDNEDMDDHVCEELDVEDKRLDTEIKLTLLDVYMNHLRERARRKRIICKMGLINMSRSTLSWLRYESVVGVTKIGSIAVSPFRRFVSLVAAEEFNKFLESMQHQSELEQRIKWLQEFRESGIISFSGAAIHQKLKSRRDGEKSTQRVNQTVLQDIMNRLETKNEDEVNQSQCNLMATACDSIITGAVENAILQGSRPFGLSRKMAPPLDITGLPGFDKLDDKEKELCSHVRFVPDAYLEFKTMLLNECSRNNGALRLAQARQLVKIDVNKTRKLYDFLVQEGLIKNSTN